MVIGEDQKRVAARKFVEKWTGRGNEKSDTQSFWLELLRTVVGLHDVTSSCRFEVRTSSGGFIDVVIADSKTIIEQKSSGVNLDTPEIRQGRPVTPYQQAKAYADALPNPQRPDFIVVCNFDIFRVHDLRKENPETSYFEFTLQDLGSDPFLLEFLVDTENAKLERQNEVSIQAGELIGRLHELLQREYIDAESEASQHALNVLCVRLVFCLFAEDAGLFSHNAFERYLRTVTPAGARKALLELFEVLDTPVEERDPYLIGELANFPYVNGGLFKERVQIPNFTQEIYDLLLNEVSAGTNWARISPTIFGGIFESTLNPEVRRKGGMHYTSPENIHRCIDPLFLDDLRAELADILEAEGISDRKRRAQLRSFQNRLASLEFLDPAAGSGNFLTETYIWLRRLENRVLAELSRGQSSFEFEGVGESQIKVSLRQMHAIEINEFAVQVARTALWIAELQANAETSEIIQRFVEDLPLHDSATIVCANALRIDWNEVLPASDCDFIIGNPPFIGYSNHSAEQKKDRAAIMGKKGGVLDYVACWYQKSADYMAANKRIEAALVSTNSICQGQQVQPLWQPLFEQGIVINFAHRTFVWNNQASNQAHVHVIIVGFAYHDRAVKTIYHHDKAASTAVETVKHINAYLIEAPDTFITKRTKPLGQVPEMAQGFKPADGGSLLMWKPEMEEFLKLEPEAAPWIRKFSMGAEFINGKDRYCLWLPEITPAELNKLPHVRQHIEACREFRLAQVETGDAYKLADQPHLLRPTRKFKDGTYIGVPKVSSERRKYIPLGFVSDGMIPGDKLYFIPTSDLYIFGVLMSVVHNAWMRVVGGRLKSDYSYANTIIYNNLVWPDCSDDQRAEIEVVAQSVLDARAQYQADGTTTLADLYDPDNDYLYPALTKAHKSLDAAVLRAYGLPPTVTEEQIVAHLFQLYNASL